MIDNLSKEDIVGKENKVCVFDIIGSLSNAIDLVDSSLYGHHIRVAYIALKIAKTYGLKKEQIDRIIMAACIHDIGAIGLHERYNILDPDFESDGKHEEIGYYYVRESKLFTPIADYIRYHHIDWDYGQGEIKHGTKIPIESQIIHLADRIDTYINKYEDILYQVKYITNRVNEKGERSFNPELIQAFNEVSKNESFWLYLISNNLYFVLKEEADLPELKLNISDYKDIANWFSYYIDFKSEFTLIHSIGVAESAKIIGREMNLSQLELDLIEIAGYLHDVGKLAVPNSILEKNGKLDELEYSVIKSHTFYTYNLLKRIKQVDLINKYASYHHEHIDGSGYPFHVKGKEMLTGSRIIAVADVTTALCEDRPYRKGMSKEVIVEILKEKGNDKDLDSKIVDIAIKNIDTIMSEIHKVQIKTEKVSKKFWNQVKSVNYKM